MHIKSIQLDGFKSYQKCTDITGFSDRFNAITGYNGSGKSNVLDSICFILGINKLDNIRAKSMHELISHGGTKATVQIRFDNRDKDASPYGMEAYDEIIVQRTILAQPTGKGCTTNYLLNGHQATNSKIHDFFRSIGLNVNNPHFLIMQGRITTVLNMKPEEILGMVEEAAGTKMYDQKKKDAERTMTHKILRLVEVDQIFSQNIDPRMEKFREDRKNMVEVTRLNKMKENTQRKINAYDYYQTVESGKRSLLAMEKSKEDVQKLIARLEEIRKDIVQKEEEKRMLEQTQTMSVEGSDIGKESQKLGDIKLKKEEERNGVVELIRKLKNDRERIEKSLQNDRNTLEKKKKELEETRLSNEQEINQHKDDEAKVAKFRNDLESLTRGTVANDQGEHVSIDHEIQESRTKVASMEASITTASNRRDRLKPRIQKLTKEHDSLAKQNSNEIDELTRITKHIEAINAKIEELGFDAESDNKLRQKVEDMRDKLRAMEEADHRLVSNEYGGRYLLNYTPPPIPTFNPKTDILGYVATLIRMKEGFEAYGQAADAALGSLTLQIVVRNQDIARMLIDCKCFTARRTMIPISENARARDPYNHIGDHAFGIAQQIAAKYGQNVERLMDMLEYPEYIDGTMQSYGGRVLVVDTIQCAKEIAFHKEISCRVVTKRGDDVKPTGMMSGGYIPSESKSTLVAFIPLIENRKIRERLEKELEPLSARLAEDEKSYKDYQKLTDELTKAQRKLAQIKMSMKHSALGVVQKDLDEATKELATVEVEIENNSQLLVEMKEKVRTLETLKSNDKNSQDKRKKELTAMLQKAEKDAAQKRDNAERAKRQVLLIVAAVEEMETQIKNDSEELEKLGKAYEEAEAKLPLILAECAEATAVSAKAQEKMEELKNAHRQAHQRISRVLKDHDTLRKDETRTKGKIEEKEKEVTSYYESEKALMKQAEALLKKHEWLADEQVHFNKKGGIYDFEGYSINKGNSELKELNDRIEKLERHLCVKNVSNLDTCEAKVIDIKNKRMKLDDDFQILRKTIKALDRKKTDELKRAYESVNDDFGKIFSCLLPDAHAKLVAPEGKTIMDGLEVKVSFNGVVKESLQELSGGQRSLVALSLILAMLKFKPAPLYILDEVDAALDLSHTANIGMMIKSHFRNSQFIIVSLKQGMFSNADVLFQTHFADGHSTCTRLVGAALEKAKHDAKLAKQAQEMSDVVKSAVAAKKKQKAIAAAVDEEMPEDGAL